MKWNSDKFDKLLLDLNNDASSLSQTNDSSNKPDGFTFHSDKTSLPFDDWDNGFSKNAAKYLNDSWGDSNQKTDWDDQKNASWGDSTKDTAWNDLKNASWGDASSAHSVDGFSKIADKYLADWNDQKNASWGESTKDTAWNDRKNASWGDTSSAHSVDGFSKNADKYLADWDDQKNASWGDSTKDAAWNDRKNASWGESGNADWGEGNLVSGKTQTPKPKPVQSAPTSQSPNVVAQTNDIPPEYNSDWSSIFVNDEKDDTDPTPVTPTPAVSSPPLQQTPALNQNSNIVQRRSYTPLYGDDEIRSTLLRYSLIAFFGRIGSIILAIVFFKYGLIILGILATIAVFSLPHAMKSKQTNFLKSSIITEELFRAFEAKNYEHDTSLLGDVAKLKLFNANNNDWATGTISDKFNGTYNNCPFIFYDVTLKKTEYINGKSKEIDCFHGQMLDLSFDAIFLQPFEIFTSPYQLSQKDVEEWSEKLNITGKNKDLLLRYRLREDISTFEKREYKIGIERLLNENKKMPVNCLKLNMVSILQTLDQISIRFQSPVYLKFYKDRVLFRLEREYDPFEFEKGDALAGVDTIRSRVRAEIQEFSYILFKLTHM